MPDNSSLQRRVARLTAQAAAQDDAYTREWWRRPGAVEEARREGERKLADFLMNLYAQEDPAYLTGCFTACPGYPDAYSEDERVQIILRELFHGNTDLKADIQRAVKERMQG